MAWVILVSAAAVGFYMAWTIGANDVANSMGPVVGSGSVTVRQALIVAGLCELAGAVLVGSHVTDTIRKGIVNPTTFAGSPEVLCLGMGCALLASALWLHLATWFGMPVSTSHSIVGAVAGIGVVAAGWASVDWGVMGRIVASWFISPVAGLVLGFVLFRLITRFVLGTSHPMAAAVRATPAIVFGVVVIVTLATIFKGLRNLKLHVSEGGALLLAAAVGAAGALVAAVLMRRRARAADGLPLAEQLLRVERVFVPLAVVSACSVAFAHGANDVANAVGPLAAVADIVRTGGVKACVGVPLWVLVLGGVGIVVGLGTFGRRVMRTVGGAITEITPSRAVAVNIAAAATVLVCSRRGLPVSTSHTIVGAVLGVGFARGIAAVNKRIARDIFVSWILTVPAAAAVAVTLFLLGRAVGADALIGQAIQSAAP